MLTCEELIESLADYVEGRMTLTEKAAAALHFLCCRDCQTYLHNYEATISASRKAFAERDPSQTPVEVPEDLVQAILKARQGS